MLTVSKQPSTGHHSQRRTFAIECNEQIEDFSELFAFMIYHGTSHEIARKQELTRRSVVATCFAIVADLFSAFSSNAGCSRKTRRSAPCSSKGVTPCRRGGTTARGSSPPW